MPVRISVVVAVYNPGPSFEDLVSSLLRQTLPASDFEVWFCDDESDETTVERLRELTEAYAHLKMLQIPHSGWPGTPRNAGIAAATGEYLFFADHDDWFGDDALRTMVDHADAWGSDVLVPRLTRVGRRLSMKMFARDVPDARLGVDPLLEYLTPHKLFRTAMVREHGIRFPDGKVRLEDHMFVMASYFAASRISILADYPCYYWSVRQDKPSASVGQVEPVSYFVGSVGTVLDIVEANTEPGELRDRLLTHWYGNKVLNRLGGQAMLAYPDDYREHLLDVLEPWVAERFPERLDALMPFPRRVRSALFRAGRRDALVGLAELEVEIRCWAEAQELTWTDDGRLAVRATAELRNRDGSAVPFADGPAGQRVWQVPADLAPGVLTPDVLDASRDRADEQLVIMLNDKGDGTDCWLLDAEQERLPDDRLGVRVDVDPLTARLGGPVGRRSELGAAAVLAGWPLTTVLRVTPELLEQAGPRQVGELVLTPNLGRREQVRLYATPAPRPVQPAPPPPPAPELAPDPHWKQVAKRVRRSFRRLPSSGSGTEG